MDIIRVIFEKDGLTHLSTLTKVDVRGNSLVLTIQDKKPLEFSVTNPYIISAIIEKLENGVGKALDLRKI